MQQYFLDLILGNAVAERTFNVQLEFMLPVESREQPDVEQAACLARQAGTFKSKNRMSFADCFAASLAKEHKADLVTGDKEFKQVEGDIRIVWL